MTHEDIVQDRRVRLIEHAAEIGNVTEACQVLGISRKTYYVWVKNSLRSHHVRFGRDAERAVHRPAPEAPLGADWERVAAADDKGPSK